jgi:serine/threonine protein kinase
MTTRDPRSRAPDRPETGREGSRDPTASISLEIDEPAHPSLAVGTHEAAEERTDRTKIESPGGRNKTPPPREPRGTAKSPPDPGSPEDPETRIGSQLGSYRLLELLGKGGMGFVYRSEHVKLGREVALKLLRPDYARRRDAVLRFFQEAKTVNRVRHRNIVDVTDFIELDDGMTFIIMEFLRGTSLGKWARTGVDLPRALAVLVQICDGLGAAHAVGVVHRDLKPDNVIVVPTSDGAELVKLLDFGVAKLLNRDDEDIGFQTQAGSVIGTPAYMSPEQAGGMAVDHRSDIYSLGAIMYELFCGQPMFRGRSFGEYVRKHLTEQPVPPRQTQGGAGLDPQLEALILRCLAKDPNERFGHILELRDGLLHMLGGVDSHSSGYAALSGSSIRPMASQLPALPLPAPQMVTTVPTPPHQMSTLHPSTLSPSQVHYYTQSAMQEPAQPTPWLAWIVGGAFAVGLGVVGAVWYASRTASTVEPSSAPSPVAAPSTTPIESPPPARPRQLELRFDSLPSGGVYADGHSAELCRTPCAFDVDLADGESTDHRTFVVRSDGYRDKPVEVDLAGAQREFHVTLERLAPPVPVPAVSDKGDERPAAAGKRGVRGKKPTDKKSDKPGDKTSDKSSDKPIDTTVKPDDKADKTDKKSDKPVRDPSIDPTDTLDPFHRQK